MEEEANSKEIMVRYLLGLSSQVERDRFEADLLADHRLLEELGAVEDELIDDYVSDELSPSYRERFEGYFLLSPEHQKGLRFAKSFHTLIAKSRGTPASNIRGRTRGLWRALISFIRGL